MRIKTFSTTSYRLFINSLKDKSCFTDQETFLQKALVRSEGKTFSTSHLEQTFSLRQLECLKHRRAEWLWVGEWVSEKIIKKHFSWKKREELATDIKDNVISKSSADSRIVQQTLKSNYDNAVFYSAVVYPIFPSQFFATLSSHVAAWLLRFMPMRNFHWEAAKRVYLWISWGILSHILMLLSFQTNGCLLMRTWAGVGIDEKEMTLRLFSSDDHKNCSQTWRWRMC